MNHEYLTRKQAGAYLQVLPATIDRWLKRGLLQGSQIVPRGTIRISAVSVEKMIEKSRQKFTPTETK